MNICLLHSSARPTKWKIARDLFLSTAEDPGNIQHVLAFDRLLEHVFRPTLDSRTEVVVNTGQETCVAGFNVAAAWARKNSNADIYVTLADDLSAPAAWDKKLLEIFKGKTLPLALHANSGLWNNDKPGSQLITMPIFNRQYLMLDDYFFYPEYLSMFCDDDWGAVAYLRGCVARVPELIFQHLHHSIGLGIKDDVAIRQDNEARYLTGKAIYERRKKMNFGV